MTGSRLLMGSGSAVSIVVHLALLSVAVLFANARPFDPTPSQAIAIDIVAPEDVKPPAEQQKPPEQKQPDPVDFSALTAKPSPQTQTSPAQQVPQQKSQPSAAASRPAQASATQAAASPPAADAPMAMPSAQTASPPPAPPASAGVPTVEPDVTVKYGVALGLPTTGGDYSGIDSPAIETAKVSAADVAALRRHLKSCSALPPSVAPTDKVRIVLRVALSRDGRLMTEPALIEASASAKGPALMQKAMDALQACQPYAMLPADKYNEWKVLDLPFTPQDFVGG
jgi:hypothetical protein